MLSGVWGRRAWQSVGSVLVICISPDRCESRVDLFSCFLLLESVLIRLNDPLRKHDPCGFLTPRVNWSVLKLLKGTSVCCPACDTKGHQMHCPRVHQQPCGHRHTPRLRGVRGSTHLWPGQPSLSSLHKMFPSTLMTLFPFAGPQRVVRLYWVVRTLKPNQRGL